ncbi:SulP family inorganic anion transporter [Leptolyngbya sp. PCC 6406]|uniref:SulP family inorganic anion transporter n=1 Tax=Leptolyngbya sp. PCC 6406 TaxID=1173264 RepID=UPI0002AC9785|nr:solute carrier family 26 protein [Leptolyngbya sp. PCC 6406]
MPSPLSSTSSVPKRGPSFARLSRYVPLLTWLPQYRREDLVGDTMAGIIVAIMLVPQAMAYALLAGLPPQVGLYASILPLMLYAALGTSRTLAVGPVAMISLMVASGIAPLAESGANAIAIALTLALMVGLIQTLMGVIRLGFVVNFLSHAVIVGFTNAAALVIGVSQVKHVLGVQIPRSENFFATLHALRQGLPDTNGPTLTLGLGSLVVLLGFSHLLPGWLERWGVPPGLRIPLSRSGPLLVVIVTTGMAYLWGLDRTAGVAVVGSIPQGLSPLTVPSLNGEWVTQLLPTALTISFVGFMESVAVAKSLASKRRQRIDPNQELIGLGVANIGAAFTGGYPVTGGFSRSVVNFTAGANTGLASLITAVLVAFVVLFFTPLFAFLPQATLAAVILVAVVNLLDFRTLGRLWRIDRGEALALGITFLAVLFLGIEPGILAGFGVSVLFFLGRTSRPHFAEVGRLGDSEHFRNVVRHPVTTSSRVIAIRIDESLYFANTRQLEDYLMGAIARHPEAEFLLLIWSAVNHVDASALETLETLISGLREAGIQVYLSDVKGPVMDQLELAHFVDFLGRDRIFLSAHEAMATLG